MLANRRPTDGPAYVPVLLAPEAGIPVALLPSPGFEARHKAFHR